MSRHLERYIDLRRRREADADMAEYDTDGDATSLEHISVYLELINHAESRAQALAGMAGTALGVFFAAFIAAFVTDSGTPSTIVKIADLISEIVFVIGAFLLLYCIFQALRPMDIENPWDEEALRIHWREVDDVHEDAARSFWIGTVMLAVSIGILIAADVLVDLGFFAPPAGT